jgi:mono/diheme cytochrome c family protein
VEEYLAQAVTTVATPHTQLPAPRARFGIGASLSTNQIYVAGGVDDSNADKTTVFEYSVATQGAVPGPPGTPSGAWVTRGNLSTAHHGLQMGTPPGVVNLLPFRSTGRDDRQDAIALWVDRKIRSARAPVTSKYEGAERGRALFGEVGLTVANLSCATCHGGPKWTRSAVDYAPPPSPDDSLGLGSERVIGAEIRNTKTQGTNAGQFPGVLINVGTFTATGRSNEIRFNGADVSQAIAPLGANGFNIPSLLSVHETAPYFYSGLAQTLEQVLDGSQDGNGGTRVHFVVDAAKRGDLIFFLRSIDEKTHPFK